MGTALIAASAAVLGGLLTAFANRSIEAMRVDTSLAQEAEKRKLEAIERFLLAVNAWLDLLIYGKELIAEGAEDAWSGKEEELNARVRARDDAYRELVLLASDDLYDWLVNVYGPVEFHFKQTYSEQVRSGLTPNQEAESMRREFGKLLREDMVAAFRPELATLRNPTVRASRLRLRSRR